MPLNLYRRHRPDCEGGHPYDSRSGEFEERKKAWRKCSCYIFASGTLARRFKRKYTGSSDWTEAKAVAAQWERQGSWDGEPIRPASLLQTADERLTIVDATDAFIANPANRGIAT